MIAEPPPWLVELLRPRSSSTAVHTSKQKGMTVNGTRGRVYADSALLAEADLVRQAVHGCRNDALNVAAFKMGTLVAIGALDTHNVVRVLAAAAEEAGLERPEIGRTIGSGLAAGLRSPRSGIDR